MVLAGWLADRVGKVRIISIYLFLLAGIWSALALTAQYWSMPGYIHVFVYVLQFIETFSLVAVLATAMNLCWTRVAATQFTLYMVSNNMGLVVGAMLLGPLREYLSWSGMFLALAGMLVSAVVIWRFVRLADHSAALDRVETDFRARAQAIPVDLGQPSTWR